MSKNKKQSKLAAPVTPVSQPKLVFDKVASETVFWQRPILQSFIIFIISILLYSNTITHDYAQDDAIVITENMFTSKGISGWSGLLNYDTFYGFFKEEGKAQLVAGGRYRPFTLMMFGLEYEIFGKNPHIGHFFNLLWYALNNVCLYFLLLKLLQHKNPEQHTQNALSAFCTALLFAAHPVHTEVVANIKGRDEIMTLLGSLGATWYIIRYFETQKWINLLISSILFFIALLSKENAIMFLLIIPLIIHFFIGKAPSSMFLPLLSLIIATTLFIGLRISAGVTFGGEQLELLNNPFLKLQANEYVPLTASEKFGTIFFTLGKYLLLLFFPHPLTHDYYPRHIEIMDVSNTWVILSLGIYLLLILGGIRRFMQGKILGFGILFYLITLFIVSNLLFPVGTNMSERFLFMPSVGFCIVLSSCLLHTLKPNIALIIVSIITILFGIKTFDRNFAWKDDYTLFTTDVEISKNSAKVQCSAGGQMVEKAFKDNPAHPDKNLLQKAIGHLNQSLAIHPLNKNAYLLLGNAYYYMQDFDKAIETYQKTLQIAPAFKDAQNNLFKTYRDAGKYYGEVKQNPQKCIELLEKAAAIQPNDFETIRLLGVAHGIFNHPDKALSYFQRAVELEPQNAQAVYDLGSAYGNAGNFQKAKELHEQALKMKPDLLKR